MSYRDAGTAEEITDRELVERARDGVPDAMETLWERHARAGHAAARRITRSFDSDDLVQEAFARTLTAIRKGMGPTGPFRPYLYTAIRNIATSWARQGGVDVVDEVPDVADPASDFSSASLDKSLTVRAFRTLPDDWRAVLWYADVEGMGAKEIAPMVGLTPGAVSSLTYRAREGLRRAWIQAHISDTAVDDGCRWAVERIPGLLRGSLSPVNAGLVEDHVAGCARCTRLVAELGDVSRTLRVTLLPLVLGAGVLTLDVPLASAGAAEPARQASSSALAEAGGAAARETATGIAGSVFSKVSVAALVSVGGAAAVVASVAGLWFLAGGGPGDMTPGASPGVVRAAPPYDDGPRAADDPPDPTPAARPEPAAPADDPDVADDDADADHAGPEAPAVSPARHSVPDAPPDEPDRGRPGPAAPGKVPDPAAPDPAAPDPVEPDPVEPDPVEPDPVEPDPVEPDPSKPDPVAPEPSEPDPGESDPAAPDPGDPDPDDPEAPASTLAVTDVTRDHLLPRVSGTALPGALVEARTASGEPLGSTHAGRHGDFVLDLERSSPTSDVLIHQVDDREPHSATVSIGPVAATGPNLALVGASTATVVVPEGVEPRNQWVTVGFDGPDGAFAEIFVDGAHRAGAHLLTASRVELTLRGLDVGSHEFAARYVDRATGRVSELSTVIVSIVACPTVPPTPQGSPEECTTPTP